MQAMILAAGFGTRLRPYTLVRPKPLFPVLNTPLLCALVQRLQHSGCRRIVVNAHHLGEQIGAALAAVDGVVVQHEPAILGTGGGLRQALAGLDDEPLLVVNGDIYHDLDLAELYRRHLRSGHEATMVLHDCPRFNKIAVRDGRIVDFDGAPGGAGALAYTGVQVVDPGLLDGIKKEGASCIIEYYRSLTARGRNIHGLRRDCFWTDIGTPGDYLELHRALFSGEAPCWPELQYRGGSCWIHPEADRAADLRIEGWACVGRARIGAGVTLCRSVVWDGAEIGAGRTVADQIVAPSVV